ncbi:MAG TPA: hypothetical protein VGH34_05570 [Vicinamibacterales bacterium]
MKAQLWRASNPSVGYLTKTGVWFCRRSNDRSWTTFGHTGGHTGGDANVCRSSTHCRYADGSEVFAWDDPKNATLKADRGIGFEDVVFHIERGDLLDILEHPNPDRYAGQRIIVVQREDDVYLVPFVEDEHFGVPEDDHPEPGGHEAFLGEESDHED